MGAITEGYGIGEASVRALEAGADVLLSPKDVPAAIDAVVAAVESGRIGEARIDTSVRRILEIKARLGLNENRLTSLENVDQVVGTGPHLAFADTAATRSITLPRDASHLVPMLAASAGRVLHVRYAPSTWLWAGRAFAAGLAQRVPSVESWGLDERSDSSVYAAVREALGRADRVIFSAYVSPSAGSGEDAVPEPLRRLVADAVEAKPTVLLSFGNPYLLNAFPTVGSYLIAWGDREVSQNAALKALFGEEAITGRLPIPLPPYHGIGDGLDRPKVAVFTPIVAVEDPLVAAGIVPRGQRGGTAEAPATVADPSSVGMDSTKLARLDSIIRAALADSAASGAALSIGRHGRIVKLAGYGELAYGSGRPATPTSIWDLASVSKVVGTTTEAMMMVQDGRLDLDAKVVHYLPWWSRGDARKNDVTVRQLLLHRSGLPAFKQWFFDHQGKQAYKDAAADEPLESDPGTATVYSDIGIMTLSWIMESITGEAQDVWLQEHVFGPLGMLDTEYNPDPSLKPRIAATELDTLWRHEMVWGRVHDENADAMGGVAGHAGLFSSAVDLSVFARMMLNDGVAPACVPGDPVGEPCPVARPNPVRVVDPEVLHLFTRRWDAESSRGLGWDTPSEGSSGGDYVTPDAFGHTGFTGTSIWMDPDLDIWIILLTNRVHPTRANQKHIALRRAVADAAVLAITDQPVHKREPGLVDHTRLGDHRPLLRLRRGHRPGAVEPGGALPVRLLRGGAVAAVVAGRHLHGGHHLRRGYAAGRDGDGRAARRGGELALVEHGDERDPHRVLLRAAVAARRRDHRRRVHRAALRRQAGGAPARLPRRLPRAAHQPDHHGVGEPGDDGDREHHARHQPGGRPPRVLPPRRGLLGHGRAVGRGRHGLLPVRPRHWGRRHPRDLRRPRGGRHRGDAGGPRVRSTAARTRRSRCCPGRARPGCPPSRWPSTWA